MATIPQVRQQLMEGFPEAQADLMARVFVQCHDDLVTKAEFNELTGVMRELAEAQTRTEVKVGELAEAQKRTEVKFEELTEAQKRTEVKVEELAEAQKRTEVKVGELVEAQKRTEVRFEELTEAQKRTEVKVEELAEAQKRTEVKVEELADAQAQSEVKVGRLSGTVANLSGTVANLSDTVANLSGTVTNLSDTVTDLSGTVTDLVVSQKSMLIRLDRLDGRSLELLVKDRLPAYLGRRILRCKVISPAELTESLMGKVSNDEIDDFLRADLVASGTIDGSIAYVVGEVSCTADRDDIERAVRRSAVMQKVGFVVIPIIACEIIPPQVLDLAHRRGVEVLVGGQLMSAA